MGFLSGNFGQPSSKRLAGFILILQGALTKFILFLYSLFKIPAVEFDKLDSSADNLIYVGAALIGAGLVELFKKKK